MRKGQKKRIWTPEQKLEIVKKHLDEHISVCTLEKEYGAEHMNDADTYLNTKIKICISIFFVNKVAISDNLSNIY